MEQVLEVCEVIRRAVRHSSLEVVPDEFVRVELGCVAGELLHTKPGMHEEEVTDQDAAMRTAAVPEEHHGAAKVPQQLPEELDHLDRADVLVAMEPGVQGQATPTRRHPMAWLCRREAGRWRPRPSRRVSR